MKLKIISPSDFLMIKTSMLACRMSKISPISPFYDVGDVLFQEARPNLR